MGQERTVYHGSKVVVEYPEIRKGRFNKDFYFGFYCTNLPEQAKRWAVRFTGKEFRACVGYAAFPERI